jgi:hypothetical protein
MNGTQHSVDGSLLLRWVMSGVMIATANTVWWGEIKYLTLSYLHKWQIHNSAEMSCLQIYWILTKFVVLGDVIFSWQ